MTYEYNTLIGDGREIVTVFYDIDGVHDDFEIEILQISFKGKDIIGCLLTQQIVELEMELIRHHNKLLELSQRRTP
jgi:hypothetical protein